MGFTYPLHSCVDHACRSDIIDSEEKRSVCRVEKASLHSFFLLGFPFFVCSEDMLLGFP